MCLCTFSSVLFFGWRIQTLKTGSGVADPEGRGNRSVWGVEVCRVQLGCRKPNCLRLDGLGASRCSICGRPLPGPQMAISSLCPHGGRGKGSLWDLFYKGTNPIDEGLTLVTYIHFREAPPPDTITVGLGFQHMHFGVGHIQPIARRCHWGVVLPEVWSGDDLHQNQLGRWLKTQGSKPNPRPTTQVRFLGYKPGNGLASV